MQNDNQNNIFENHEIKMTEIPFEGAVIKPESYFLKKWKMVPSKTQWNYLANNDGLIRGSFEKHFKKKTDTDTDTDTDTNISESESESFQIYSPLLRDGILDFLKSKMTLVCKENSDSCSSYFFESEDCGLLCHQEADGNSGNKKGGRYLEFDSFYHKVKDYSECPLIKDVVKEASESIIFADEEPTVYLIVRNSMGSYDLDSCSFEAVEVDFDSNYNNGFEDKVHKALVEMAKDKNPKKGRISLLHGPAGTGKSFYLRSLISKIAKDAKVIYVPSYLVESIADPSFIDFMREQNGSWLIIEDGEAVICGDGDSTHRSAGTSNLLQVTDGLLGDILNLRIIVTFNTDLANIDEALKRSGRMFLEYKFDLLSKEKTNAKLKSLGFDEVDKKMTLAEIYNLKHDNKRSDKKENEKGPMGFLHD